METEMDDIIAKLDRDITGYLSDNDGATEFINFLEETMPKEQFQNLLSAWLNTKEGQKWYEEMLDILYNREENRQPEWTPRDK